VTADVDRDGLTCGAPTLTDSNSDAITVTDNGATATAAVDQNSPFGDYTFEMDCGVDDGDNALIATATFRLVQEQVVFDIAEATADYRAALNATWHLEGADSCALLDGAGNDVLDNQAVAVTDDTDNVVNVAFPAADEDFQLSCVVGADPVYAANPTDTVEVSATVTFEANTALDNGNDALNLRWRARPNANQDPGVNLAATSCALSRNLTPSGIEGDDQNIFETVTEAGAGRVVYSLACANDDLGVVDPDDIAAFFGTVNEAAELTALAVAPAVRFVVGDVQPDNTLVDADLAKLGSVEEVSGLFEVRNNDQAGFTSLPLTSLRKIGLDSDGFEVSGNDFLIDFSATALVRVAGTFTFSNNTAGFNSFSVFPFPNCDSNQENAGTGALPCARIGGNFAITGNGINDTLTGEACNRSARLAGTDVTNNPAACQ
jgi:hypothetical protein